MNEIDRQIVYSAMRTPDGTILESKHGHDYVQHTQEDGKYYMLDGGCNYQRYSSPGDHEWLTVYADEPFEKVRQYANRGGRGKDGTQPLTWIKLKDMTDEHLEGVVDYSRIHHTETWHLILIQKEIQYRKDNDISIKDGN